VTPQPPVLDLNEHLVRTGAWWDLVDEIATHLVQGVLLAHPRRPTRCCARAVSDDLWVRRSAIICQCGTREQCDQSLLAEAVRANLDGSTRTTPAGSPYGRERFVRKAIGWARPGG
jgi:3-methyladenine DNA glycosylase AlkD